MSRTPRRLFLHISALTDAEYTLYASALRDVLDCADANPCHEDDLENQVLGIREVRAWLKGRYRDVPCIDQILRMFCPDMGSTDTIKGGQFLAALRLVTHARNGREISEGMVFLQAIPVSTQSSEFHVPTALSPSMADSPAPDTPTSTAARNPFKQAPDMPQQQPPAPPPPSHPTSRSRRASVDAPAPSPHIHSPFTPPSFTIKTNPFLQRSKSQAHASPATEFTNIVPPLPSVKALPSTAGKTKIPPLPPRKPAGLLSSPPKAAAPPLHPLHPTHKPTPPPKPGHAHTQSLGHPFTSTLMKQSLHASKAGSSLKQAQAQLERERVLEVIRTSAPAPAPALVATQGGSGSRSPKKIFPAASAYSDEGAVGYGNGNGNGGLEGMISTRRRVPSPPRSTGGESASSLEQVAGATLASSSSRSSHSHSHPASSSPSRSRSPVRQQMADAPPPPLHPDRRLPLSAFPSSPFGTPESPFDLPPSPSSPGTPRPTRSKSLHHPHALSGGSGPPLPPPRRKRPESVQVTPSREIEDVRSPFANAFAASKSSPFLSADDSLRSPSTSPGFRRSVSGLSRHISLAGRSPSHLDDYEHARERDHEREREPLSLASLQKTLTQLQSRAQPTLERALFKAEAGLSRRGYVRHARAENGEEMLVERERGPGMDGAGEGADVDSEGVGGVDADADADEWSGDDRTVRGRRKREMDELKLPAGDGWKPL